MIYFVPGEVSCRVVVVGAEARVAGRIAMFDSPAVDHIALAEPQKGVAVRNSVSTPRREPPTTV